MELATIQEYILGPFGLGRIFEAEPARYGWAVGSFLSLTFLLFGGRALLRRILVRFASKTPSKIYEALKRALEGIRPTSLFLAALLGTLLALRPVEWLRGMLVAFLAILIVYHFAKFASAFVEHMGQRLLRKKALESNGDGRERASLQIVSASVKIFIWIAGILFVLSNLGINITSLVAGLGIGGIVIGFALQAVLEDIFSSLSIHFDKPFQKGDFIVVDNKMGTVEKIGIKTTRLHALSGEQVIIANSDLTSSRIHNYKRMPERRVEFRFRLPLDTPLEMLKKLPPLVTAIIGKKEGVRFDRSHLKEYAPDACVFETVYIVLSDEYNRFMDIHQSILFEIRERLDAEGVAFAYPAQSIYVAGGRQGDSRPVQG